MGNALLLSVHIQKTETHFVCVSDAVVALNWIGVEGWVAVIFLLLFCKAAGSTNRHASHVAREAVSHVRGRL